MIIGYLYAKSKENSAKSDQPSP